MTRAKTTLVWPDTHFGIENQLAIEVAKKVVRDVKPDEVVLLGDILDCAEFGSHPKSQVLPDGRSKYLEHEISPANALLDYIAKNTRKMVYLEGNHEYRVERHCANTRGAEAYFEAVDPKRLLGNGRSKSSWSWVPYLDVAGGVYNTYTISEGLEFSTPLVATHGWSVAKRAAAAHMDVGRGVSVVYGHTHRAEMLVDRDPWTDRPIVSFSPGCLCKLSKPYTGSKPTSWTHGLGIIFTGRRSWTAYNIQINAGQCVLPSGKQVRV